MSAFIQPPLQTHYRKELKTLIPKDETFAFYSQKTLTSPQKLLKLLLKRLDQVDEGLYERYYNQEIYRLYHTTLYSLISHALVEGKNNKRGFARRSANAVKCKGKMHQ